MAKKSAERRAIIMTSSLHIASERIHPTKECHSAKHVVSSAQSLLVSAFAERLSIYFKKHPLMFWAAALWGMPIVLVCLLGSTAFFLGIALGQLNFSFFCAKDNCEPLAGSKIAPISDFFFEREKGGPSEGTRLFVQNEPLKKRMSFSFMSGASSYTAWLYWPYI